MKIELCDLCKAFDGRPVLQNLSMKLESGKIYCLMAPSGTGKTTLFRILMGLEQADSGKVILDDGNNMEIPRKQLQISAVFQEDRLCNEFSVLDNVLMTAAPGMTREKAREELKILLPLVNPEQPVIQLSGGQKRRVALCRALCASFDLLILDEPFTGLDEESKKEAIRYLKQRCAGKLTLLSTHQKEDVAVLGGIPITISGRATGAFSMH